MSNVNSLIVLEHYVDAEDEPVELFVITVEEASLFQAAYPDVVALYQMEKSEALAKKQKSKSKSLYLMNLWFLPEYQNQKQQIFLPLLSNIMFDLHLFFFFQTGKTNRKKESYQMFVMKLLIFCLK